MFKRFYLSGIYTIGEKFTVIIKFIISGDVIKFIISGDVIKFIISGDVIKFIISGDVNKRKN